jgi:hypothetical protein
MKQPDKNPSLKKENRKVRKGNQLKDNKVREDENNSIDKQANDKLSYPYKDVKDTQYDDQPEFIDRNNDSKDKS